MDVNTSKRGKIAEVATTPLKQEFVLFGLMAICGGLLGGLFNCANKRLGLASGQKCTQLSESAALHLAGGLSPKFPWPDNINVKARV